MQCLRCGVHCFVAGSCRWRRGPRRRRRVGWVPKYAAPHRGGSWNAGLLKGPRFDCVERGRGGRPFSTCHGGITEVAILFGPVVRYSSRFASLLDQDAAADPPSYGHSETAVPTLCNMTSWCALGNISAAWVGINDYLLDPPITGAVLDEIESFFAGRLMHPVRDTASSSSQSPCEDQAAPRQRQVGGGHLISHRLRQHFQARQHTQAGAF